MHVPPEKPEQAGSAPALEASGPSAPLPSLLAPPGPAIEAAPVAEVLLAVPFDIDVRLDFEWLARERGAVLPGPPLRGRNAPIVIDRRDGIPVGLPSRGLAAKAREEVWVYAFEVGLLIVRFRVGRELARLADLVCDAERIEVGGRPIYAYSESRASEVLRALGPYAVERYEVRFGERDVYPIVILPPGPDIEDAERFIEANRAAIVGIVAGEDDWARLSAYALQKSGLTNLGYYVDELILAKEWGALVSSSIEEGPIVGIVLLAYAQRWALRSYNHLNNYRQDQVFKLLAQAKEVRTFRFANVFAARTIRAIARRLFEASEDRIALATAIRDFTSVPELTEDWHFHGLYGEISKTFYLGELYRVVQTKNEELERAYATVEDHLVQSRLAALELYMLVLFLLETILLLVWFLSETRR